MIKLYIIFVFWDITGKNPSFMFIGDINRFCSITIQNNKNQKCEILATELNISSMCFEWFSVCLGFLHHKWSLSNK